MTFLILLLDSCNNKRTDFYLLESYTLQELMTSLDSANSTLKIKKDSTHNPIIKIIEAENSDIEPIFSKIRLNKKISGEISFIDSSSTLIGNVLQKDTSFLNDYFNDEKIRLLFPKDLKWHIIEGNNFNKWFLKIYALNCNSSKINIGDSFIKKVVLKPTGVLGQLSEYFKESAIKEGKMKFEAWIQIDTVFLNKLDKKAYTFIFTISSKIYSCSIPKNYTEMDNLIYIDDFENDYLTNLKTKFKDKLEIKL